MTWRRGLLCLTIATLTLALIDQNHAAGAGATPRLVSAVSRIKQASANYDVALPLSATGGSGIECRAIPRGGLTILMKFDQPISGGTVAVTSGKATISGAATAAGNTLRVNLTNVANAQELVLTASNVAAPSGGAIGSAVVRFRVLEGDVNADGVVDQADVDRVKNLAVKNAAVNGVNYRSDENVSGSVSGADVSSVKGKVGTKVAGGPALNTAPSLGKPASISAIPGRPSQPIAFAVADAESDASSLAVVATSSNPTLLPDSAISITGTGTSRVLTVTPTAKSSGSATVTLTLSDGLNSVTTDVPVVVSAAPTLYLARMTPQSGINTQASGYATLQLAADELSASLQFNYSNLSSTKTGEHIHGPAAPNQNGGILFDIDTTAPDMDGAYTWTFAVNGGLSVQQQVDAIKQGLTYINIHTANYPAGEIRGQFLQVTGSQTFTPPAAPPALPSGPPTQADAARFLQQATFGGTMEDVALVQAMGVDNWIQQQIDTAPSFVTPSMLQRQANGEIIGPNQFTEAWWGNALTAPDQLRQRVAFALSEILVISQNDGDLAERPFALASYYDLLIADAFKNYRQILDDVTLNPNMGNYLDMRGNVKADPTKGTSPNENYAREVNQLFSIGVNLLWPDGTLKLDANALPIPSYDQTVIQGFARVFTGWNYKGGQVNGGEFLNPMTYTASSHETGTKALLSYSGDYSAASADRLVLPAGQTGQKDLADALNQIFMHPNIAPFVCRELIQRLVTANPSPGYVYRVVQKFNDNGQGVRGDMKAVVKAILTDYEARSTTVLNNIGYGHIKEPIVRVTQVMRAFHPVSTSGYFKMSNTDTALSQSPLKAPTVFNFFEPGYVYPGPLANNGLVAPEMEITDETSVVNYANFMYTGIGATGAIGFFQGNDIKLDLSTEQALVSNPAALVSRLNLLLMANNMSDDPTGGTGLKQRVTNFINAAAANDKVQGAIHLIVTSSEFCTQK